MAQERNVLMGLSVKAMVFHDGKLLLLQKNDIEGRHPWEFPGGGLLFHEDFEVGLRRKFRKKRVCPSPWKRRPVFGATRRLTGNF